MGLLVRHRRVAIAGTTLLALAALGGSIAACSGTSTVPGVTMDGGVVLSCSTGCPSAECQTSTCNQATGLCESRPIADGTTCSDGLRCTREDRCVGGVCTGMPRDCGATRDQCNGATCEEESGECQKVPLREGTPCDDGVPCTVNEACVGGACADGVLKDCSAFTNSCNTGTCNAGTGACEARPFMDGTTCEDGDLCTISETCRAGVCQSGGPKDCSAAARPCNSGVCNRATGACEAQPLMDATTCDDMATCTTGGRCAAGTCVDAALFRETFDNNAAGWQLGMHWGIGPAVGGCSDPALDHSPNATNGVAGLVIGGCIPVGVVDPANFFCLTSPAVNTSVAPSVYLNYWRTLTSDYTPFMKNKVEVWNGAAWVIVWESFGSPGVTETAWTRYEHDVTAHRNAAFRVRFCTNVGNVGAFTTVGSWTVDDVVLNRAAAFPMCP